MTGKLTSDSNYDLEQQFILRMTDTVAAQNLAADIDAGISFKENFTVEFKPDMRHTIVRYNGQVYQGQIMDLPCIIESLKTTDRKNFYKTANICQMMICTQGDETGPLRGTAAYLDNRPGSRNKTFDIGHENREFQFLHGITPPLKNVLHRRFRKTRRKRFVDMPKIEKEVKQLLRADLQAMNVKWEVIWTDPPAPTVRSNTNNKSSLHNNESDRCSDVEINNQQRTADDELEEDDDEDGGRAYAIDHRDVFGEISSSSIGSSSDSDDNSSNDSSLHGNDNRRRQQRREGGGGDGKRDSSSDHESDNDERVSICSSKEKEINQSSLRNRSTDNLLEINQCTTLATYNKQKSAITSPTNDVDTTTATPTNAVVVPESESFVDNLKDELAAELLLSDSGDEQDDADDNDLQTSVVAELVANSSLTNSSNIRHLHGSMHRIDASRITCTELDDLDVVVDDGDEDDVDDEGENIIHRGGELLDDNSLMGFTNTATTATSDFHDRRRTTTIHDYHNVVFNADIDDEDTL
ncbi:Transcription initiation factor TFIID subunit 7 [Schistosoma japonicum]|uniref:Transcription initiation factor TFIID subunit 7 n=1 Tax=Schistosoma japonicum TaxID=6182 RepID=A0A4Z2DG18_SCHJA|nr:Transcription initiation factor TFIID subunit 7 [Schistosoma japonicum]